MTLPSVVVTATTQVIAEVRRTRANVSYTEAVRAAGMRPYILPVLAPSDAVRMLDGADGLLLTGGEDVDPSLYGAAPHPALGDIHPQRDAFEHALILAARARRIPTLAICRGIQIANVALGGTLIQDIGSQWPNALAHDGGESRDTRVHPIAIEPDSRLATALGARDVLVNSLHHQSVDRVATGLRVVARASDGIVEGVEWIDDDWWLLGAQWHPEELTHTAEPWDRNLFNAFAKALTSPAVALART